MVVSATKGPLADPRVRQAVSYALDRKGIINTVWTRAPATSRTRWGSGTWGYRPDVFQQAYDALPALDQDIAKAAGPNKQAGVAGQTITIGTPPGSPASTPRRWRFKAAAEAVGLKVDAAEREPVELHQLLHRPEGLGLGRRVRHTNYGDYADPAALLQDDRAQGRLAELQRLGEPDVTAALNARAARPTPTKRAQDVIAAQKIITDQLAGCRSSRPTTSCHEQEHHRRAGDVPVHVRAVGRLPRRRATDRTTGLRRYACCRSSPGGWRCS